MLDGYRLYDADAHVMLCPAMWEGLPEQYLPRRPRPVRVGDADSLGIWNTGWLVDGSVEPHPLGPGAQPANTPAMVLEEFAPSKRGATASIGWASRESMTLSDPQARLSDLDRMGIDFQVLFPTTLYAHMTSDAGFEAALFRAYNRYMAGQCQASKKRLKWAGLLPLRDPREGVLALEEMQRLGATTAVVYGTAGDRLLSDPSFTAVWEALAGSGMPLSVHMGMSYPPFTQLCETIFDAHVIGMCIPALLAFVALVGHGMMDRYPELKVAFLEFGAEWILYMVARMDHYLPGDKSRNMPIKTKLPQKRIEEYIKSGRIFVGGEADDRFLVQEMALMGEGQILYSSDFPHAEAREESATEILGRKDLTREQKQKIFYDNVVKLYGEP